jgi:hypothetical protein
MRSTDELRAAAKHLAYEWQALTAAIVGILRSRRTPPDLASVTLLTSAGTALIESAAIHTRSLLHFAYPTGAIHLDDVLAEDFVAAWPTIRPPWPAALDAIRGRVGTEFAHLSYRRIPLTEEAMQWPFGEIMTALAATFQVFVANVDPEKLGDNVDPPADAEVSPGQDGLPIVFPRWPFAKRSVLVPGGHHE